jgi:hypothetical protein
MSIRRLARLLVAMLCAFVLLMPVEVDALSPILANNTFSAGSFTSWSDTTPSYTGSCSTSTGFAGKNATDEDGDAGYATGSSSASISCVSGKATIGLTQSFTINGTPTSQSYSFWYYITPATYNGGSCTGDTPSSVSNLTLVINGTTVSTTAAPTVNSAWHQVSGTTTALVSGSNTLTLTITLSSSKYATNQSTCIGTTYQSQSANIDNVVLTATVVVGGNYQPLSVW